VTVFERCDANTIAVFDVALAEARRLGHNYVGTEHLLVSLVRQRDLLPASVAVLLPTEEAVLAALRSEFDEPPPADERLLRTLGIDLGQVQAAVRRTFGDDAVERLGRRGVHQPWQPWRRPTRQCMSLLGGAMGVAPRVKQAFERARHDADRRQHGTIDPASLLLGMVDVEDALSNRLLDQVGVDTSKVRQALIDRAG
jgi:ATP-dependent Clp protease ATP-binding subunit ClpA